MTHLLDADGLFIHRIQQHCAERGWNFFLIEPLWVEAFHDHLVRGTIAVKVLLNMHSEHHLPEDVYHRLVLSAEARGVQVIDPLERALAAFDKARIHPRLAAAGFELPYTRIVSAADAAAPALTPAERAALGEPFVIKPAMGYGRRGVILDATSEADLARSRAAWPRGDYLLQRRIVPRTLGGEPAYFRVYYVFGSTWLAWWNCYTDRYRLVTADEEGRLALKPMREVVHRIAALTGLRFFSSEIAQTDDGTSVLIDYVNDQCHMLSQSAHPAIGVPDELVCAIAARLVEGAASLREAAPA